jgi:signal transduction histidine kinase
LVGMQPRYFLSLIITGLVVLSAYRVLLSLVSFNPVNNDLLMFFWLVAPIFNLLSVFISWRYRRKLKTRLIIVGIVIVAIGQLLSVFRGDGAVSSFAIIIASLGMLTLSLGVVKQEIIMPLLKRDTQIEAIYQIGMSISQLVSLRPVLDAISDHVERWFEADGVCICLRHPDGDRLVVVTAHNLPQAYLDREINLGIGVIGQCAYERKIIFLENYSRDWHFEEDFPHARHTFGSVICAPLMYGDDVIGVLGVISGKHGRLFNKDDVYSLELLSSQVAIAISHSQLFEEQKELNRMKSEVVRMASHDLKNPLMGAFMHIDLLKDQDIVNQEKSILSSVDMIELQLDRMNRIVRGVLDIEKLNALDSVSEKCSPEAVINTVLDELRYYAESNQVEIVVEIEENLPFFRGNSKQFERAIVNLVENAVKFSLNNGTITIKVVRDNNHLVFSVTDQGIGIPEEIGEHIFERFYRGQQSGVEHVTGTGLGLNIVKTIAENHNGKAYYDSEVGIGSTFYIRVPVI